jgi:hypothetical protein
MLQALCKNSSAKRSLNQHMRLGTFWLNEFRFATLANAPNLRSRLRPSIEWLMKKMRAIGPELGDYLLDCGR